MPSVFSHVNKVPKEIDKWIVKIIIKTAILEYGDERNLNNLIRSQIVQNLKALT